LAGRERAGFRLGRLADVRVDIGAGHDRARRLRRPVARDAAPGGACTDDDAAAPHHYDTLPEVATIELHPLIAGSDLRIVGTRSPSELVTIDAATGEMVTTGVRGGVMDSNVLIAGDDWVITMNPSSGQAVVVDSDGVVQTSALGDGWSLFPIGGTDLFWRADPVQSGPTSQFEQVDLDGLPTGPVVTDVAGWPSGVDPLDGGLVYVVQGRSYSVNEFGARLIADGELDLDSLDEVGGLEGLDDLNLGSDFDVDAKRSEAVAKPEPALEDGGLDFELDLTPMGDDDDLALDDEDFTGSVAESASETIELSGDEGNLDGLDLDSIDLDTIDLGDLGDFGDLGGMELEGGRDIAVARETASQMQPETAAAADEEALSDLGFNLESDLDSELNLLEGSDEVSTKLELAQAYLDMGDKDGAREILGEVVEEAAGEHQQRAKDMLERMR